VLGISLLRQSTFGKIQVDVLKNFFFVTSSQSMLIMSFLIMAYLIMTLLYMGDINYNNIFITLKNAALHVCFIC